MRIFKVKKIMELCEECGNDMKFMNSKWVAYDDLKNELPRNKNCEVFYDGLWRTNEEYLEILKLNKFIKEMK